ncbi:hypothetical protein GPROT2_03381 [Gammaproteobacteria bacterium]|nr:hypothetical protein GPROT2_03381 [Gammaproteobacteria bacterium]
MSTLAAALAGGAALAIEPDGRLAERAAVAVVATAPQRDGVLLTPEVSTVRTRLAPSDAAPLAADGRPLTELAGVNYRLWMGRGRTEFGVGVGTLGYVHHGVEGRTDGATALHRATPTVSLGIRYSVTPESAVFADASGARGLGLHSSAAYVNTKVGMEWKPAKSRLGFDHGALGVHFDSGYRLSLKARRGGLRIVLRGEF